MFAFLFPGQGAQKHQMMSGFESIPLVRQTFEEASEALKVDLWGVLFAEDRELINQTIITQPLVLTAGVAVFRAYINAGGIVPTYLAGHSLGEYAALVVAEALSFSDAVKLVQKRAELMQEAVPLGEGRMAAILGLEAHAVEAACEEAQKCDGGVVEPANYNSPQQVVIAGKPSAVELAIQIAKAKGAKKAVLLSVSVPSHCSLMRQAARSLAQLLDCVEITAPKIEVVHNVDVKVYTEPQAIRDALVRQLYSPVKWVGTISYFIEQGIREMVECAPSKVLSELNKRIDKQLSTSAFTAYEAMKLWIDHHSCKDH
ncbi:MAG: ACP S-malonyltransferase [Neisseriaceae bacterium]